MLLQYLEDNLETKMDFDFSKSQKMHQEFCKNFELPPMILVGGTNGKGSTLTFLSSILQQHDLRVGAYTSPHLMEVFERIRINNQNIAKDDFEACGTIALSMMKKLNLVLSYFEILTFTCAIYFAQQKVDVCLFEVGLGGRWDTTNAFDRIGSILTPIGWDHMEILGSTLCAIASEKAPILTKGGFNIVAEQDFEALTQIRHHTQGFPHVFIEGTDFHHNLESTAFTYNDDQMELPPTPLGLIGKHQTQNASLAVCGASKVLASMSTMLDIEKTRRGLSNAYLSGRLEIFRYKDREIIVDVAHNLSGVERLVEHFDGKKLPILVGISANKDAGAMIKALSPIAQSLHITSFDHPRAWTSFQDRPLDFKHPQNALDHLLDTTQGPILCTGSIFFIGVMVQLLQ